MAWLSRGLIVLLAVAGSAVAQVEVPEPGAVQPVRRVTTPPAVSTAAPASGIGSIQSSDNAGDLYNQILRLQQEVMTLRGTVEEQGELIRQLKQQRLDDYMSLDRRLSALGSSGGGVEMPSSPTPSAGPSGVAVGGSGAVPAQVNSAAADAAYKSAYELVKNRDFAGANSAFNAFLAEYPNGDLAGNAHYWLAELYLLEGDSAAAKRHFESLVNGFPANSKIPDGLFKLGRIYHQEGKAEEAKAMLNRVVTEYKDSGSSAPRLAEEYLRQNF